MAIVRVTADQAKASARFNFAKIDATTDAEIARHMIEDGMDPERPLSGCDS